LGGKTIKCTTTITLTNYAHASTQQMLDQEGKNVLFTSLFQNKKKQALNIPLHTNPNNFTLSFKPHTISPWDILKLKKPSKLPTNCRPKNSCMVIMLPQTNINTQHQSLFAPNFSLCIPLLLPKYFSLTLDMDIHGEPHTWNTK